MLETRSSSKLKFKSTIDVTELGNVSYFEVVSSGNDVPAPSVVTTGELASSEAYEGCFVQIINATCTNPDADYGEAFI